MPGGQRIGAGRKPVETPRSKSLNVRLTEREHEQIKELGGAAWVRGQIAKTTSPYVNTDTPMSKKMLNALTMFEGHYVFSGIHRVPIEAAQKFLQEKYGDELAKQFKPEMLFQ